MKNMRIVCVVFLLKLCFILYATSCSPSAGTMLNEKATSADSCKSILGSFNYPGDLVRLDSFKYICLDTSFWQSQAEKKDLKIIPRFDDKNYTLFYYNFTTRLLYDKRNDLLLCFKQNPSPVSFGKEAITIIYILGKDLMPVYSISRLPGPQEAALFKYYYDDKYAKPYYYELQVKNREAIKISELTYLDIIQIAKALSSGDYLQTDKLFTSHAHFKTMPLWSDW